jgi:hypothetical protein
MLYMLDLKKVGPYFALNAEQCRERGRELASKYQSALPFPHIVIDNFLSAEVLKGVLAEFRPVTAKHILIAIKNASSFNFNPTKQVADLQGTCSPSSIAEPS